MSLTVAQLVAELNKMPQDSVVWMEGCCCFSSVASVRLDTDNTVNIWREASWSEEHVSNR